MLPPSLFDATGLRRGTRSSPGGGNGNHMLHRSLGRGQRWSRAAALVWNKHRRDTSLRGDLQHGSSFGAISRLRAQANREQGLDIAFRDPQLARRAAGAKYLPSAHSFSASGRFRAGGGFAEPAHVRQGPNLCAKDCGRSECRDVEEDSRAPRLAARHESGPTVNRRARFGHHSRPQCRRDHRRDA